MIQGARTLVPRTSGVRFAISCLAATGVAALAAIALSSGARAADPLQVVVGAGEGTVAAQAYLPGQVTVAVGDSVTFTIGSDEPHSVTFGVGPDDVAPDLWPITGWPEITAAPPTPVELGETTWDGIGFINTGLLWRGSTATATFPAAGTFLYSCVIHPGMTGQIDVIEPGSGATTTQAEADAAGAATAEALLSQVETVRAARLASVEVAENPDGTKTWNIFADAGTVPVEMPGGGIGYLELYEMLPPGLEIGVGDTVHWAATGPHTVTFPTEGQDPTTIDPFGPAEGGPVYDPATFTTSGLLNAGPGAPSAFSLTFPDTGTYQYICALHQFLGQRGVIAVGQPLPRPDATASEAPAPSASPGS